MNNSIKNILLELFLNPHDINNGERWRFLGFAFFRIGVGLGALFLFTKVTPLAERLELGISTLLLFVGSLLLFLNRRGKFNLT